MSLLVLEPGLFSMIVDGGRPRTRSLGVPPGGPADRSAFVLGNSLLGNPPETTALGITLVGPALQALERVGMCICGAAFSLSSRKQRIAINHCFTLEEGEELHIGGTRNGARAYVCVAGGFQAPTILGSMSAFSPIRRGDKLICSQSSSEKYALRAEFEWPLVPTLAEQWQTRPRCLRVLPGPEADWFSRSGREIYDGSPPPMFTVTPDSNRMGLRLAGPPLAVPPREMVSQPVTPGTIQVTRGGQLILIGVDGQSIGGYPRIANVISADLDLVGQLRPGDGVTFQSVDLTAAEELGRRKRLLLDQWCLRLRAAAKAF